MSSAVSGRRAGMTSVRALMALGAPSLIGVRVAPGATALTRTLRGPNSASWLSAKNARAMRKALNTYVSRGRRSAQLVRLGGPLPGAFAPQQE